MSLESYYDFLKRKHVHAEECGFAPKITNARLFEWQRSIVDFTCRQGRAAIFAGTGLGKTAMQLEWARQVVNHSNRPVLILAPLAVAEQTMHEGEKFGIESTVTRDGTVHPGINITNYEMLKMFDTSAFAGVVLDESSILKNFTGATKRQLCASFASTPYRLCCTATPAPNDHEELGNHSEFLGIMDRLVMLSRWFTHDGGNTSEWRLKVHGERAFWDWVSSWAVAMDRPSDLGYDDGAFILPRLHYVEHVVHVDHSDKSGDSLFRHADLSATGLHREMKITAPDRATAVAKLVAAEPDETWLIWCNTDYEADELMRMVPDAVEIRGSESFQAKTRKLIDFSEGRISRLVTKPSIAGFGLNWQHCARMAFVGLSYSFESIYQAVRRCWRYGQSREVYAHVVCADTEGAVMDSIRRKQRLHEEMRAGMVGAVHNRHVQKTKLKELTQNRVVEVPSWLKSN